MPRPEPLYTPELHILEACPVCGSGRLLCILGLDLDLCLDCKRCWERLRPEDPYTVDGEMMAFTTPCDNCAFRGGSPERADTESWQYLQNTLARGGAFYCHKGVPFKQDPVTGVPIIAGKNEFDFPRKTASIDLGGAAHPYQWYDQERMRLCRGYLNAHVGPILKRYAATTEE